MDKSQFFYTYNRGKGMYLQKTPGFDSPAGHRVGVECYWLRK